MNNVCVTRHEGYIKSKVHFSYMYNMRTLKKYSNDNIDLSHTKFNSIIINNLFKGEGYLKAFNRLNKSGAFTGQLKVQGDINKQTKFIDEFLVYPPYEAISKMTPSEQDELFLKAVKAIKNYFPDIIILSAVVHRDEVLIPKDEEMKALFPEGNMTPHMHLTVIPVVHDKKKDCKRISISELWSGKNSYRKFQDYMYNTIGKEYGFDRGNIHDIGEAKKHLSVEEFKLQETSKSLKKLEDKITQKEQKLAERANVLEPEKPVTIFNIKANVEDQKAIHYALKHEKDKNALLQKEKMKLVSSLKEKDDVILNQAPKLKNQQQKISDIEKQLLEELERSNDLLNIKISNKEIRNEMINTSKKKLRVFAYKPESIGILPYSEEERRLIMDYLEDDLYSLAIKFDFCMTIRIGELKVLRWADIKGDYIYVHSFMNDKNEIIPYCKGHTEAGMRYLPLTDACKRILDDTKRINPDSDRRLKKCCKELGI